MIQPRPWTVPRKTVRRKCAPVIGPYQSCNTNKRTEYKEANTERRRNVGRKNDVISSSRTQNTWLFYLYMCNRKRYMLIEKSCRSHGNSKPHVLILKRTILLYYWKIFSFFISPQIFHELFISLDDKNRYCIKTKNIFIHNHIYTYLFKKYTIYIYIYVKKYTKTKQIYFLRSLRKQTWYI